MDQPQFDARPAGPARERADSSAFGGAALFMLLSVSLFTISHGFVRSVGDTIHPFEIAFATSLFSFTFYLPWLVRTRFRQLRTNQIGIHWIRAIFNVVAVCGWYIALTLTPLADAVALALAGPIVVTLGAMLFFGEPARLRRWIGMVAGIVGALLIIRPGFQEFNYGYWFVILNLVSMAGSRLLTEHLTQSESAAVLGAWLALLQIPITLALAVFVWSWPDPVQLLKMIAIGLLVGAAHFTLTLAYHRADLGALEPLNFLRLVIAALIGFFFFGEFPPLWTWIGGAVIVAATTYIAHRESVRRRDQRG